MLSVIIPFYNEEKSLNILINRLIEALKKINEEYEIILVDDGSNDSSIRRLADKVLNKQVKLISHKKKLGKGKALLTGFQESKGDVVAFMDADLQDDPSELPKFLEKINQGYDLVNGWRIERKDPLGKKIPSSIFNFFLLRLLLRSKFHDVNCGFKVMRRNVLEDISLYGDNYRFLPILADKSGYKTTEVTVQHHPRVYGKTKYGYFRLFSGLFDTLTTYFILKFSEKPLHFFGIVGLLFFLIGFTIAAVLTYQRIFYGMLLYRRPALLFAILLIIIGIQVIMTGIIGELIVYLHKKKK